MMRAMVEISLAGGRGFALMDDADAPLVSRYMWSISDRGAHKYAMGKLKGGAPGCPVPMHRLIMRPRKGRQVDHINNNGLDNRRVNLRTCTPSQNAMNRGAMRTSATGLKGVTFRPSSRNPNKYSASGKLNGRQFCLGNYPNAQAAHEAYCAWAKKAHGPFFRAA